ncbi:hypothetical protein IC582_011623 [Cucumis melo]
MDDLKVVNLDRGINIIRNKLHSKKVFIVLDDVDKLEQLEALVGGRDWFGQGSHPLTLVVLGSFLCTRDQAKWSSILDEFENSLNKDIRDILQLSFDGLEDKVKDIFLDISCLLVGEKVKYVKNMLSACHVNLDFGIIVLMDLSLITIENNKVQMHDLIRQMGHKIINDESSEPGKRSRLWLVHDIWDIFFHNSGTDTIKTIKLDLPNPTMLNVDSRGFRNLKNMRLLIVRYAIFSSKIEYLPNSLKWIKWHGFAQPSFPSRLIMKNLVGLDLQHSLIKKFGKRLEITSNLKSLYLQECTNLRGIHESIGSLDKLVTMDLRRCTNLAKLPTYLKLKSLRYLGLSEC